MLLKNFKGKKNKNKTDFLEKSIYVVVLFC